MRPEYSKTLDRLLVLLRRKPMTARQIATAQKCSLPVAYGRVKALISRGDAVYTLAVVARRTGPKATAYGAR